METVVIGWNYMARLEGGYAAAPAPGFSVMGMFRQLAEWRFEIDQFSAEWV